MWDCSGDPKHSQILPMFVNRADVIMIVFDATDNTSLEQAMAHHSDLSQESGLVDTDIVLCGNKIDLMTDDTTLIVGAARSFAQERGILYDSISAKSGQGVEELMSRMVQKYFPQIEPHERVQLRALGVYKVSTNRCCVCL